MPNDTQLIDSHAEDLHNLLEQLTDDLAQVIGRHPDQAGDLARLGGRIMANVKAAAEDLDAFAQLLQRGQKSSDSPAWDALSILDRHMKEIERAENLYYRGDRTLMDADPKYKQLRAAVKDGYIKLRNQLDEVAIRE